jgi:hypothetical protein
MHHLSNDFSLRCSMSLFARFLTFYIYRYIECERNRLQYISIYLDEPFALDRSRIVRQAKNVYIIFISLG